MGVHCSSEGQEWRVKVRPELRFGNPVGASGI